MALLPSIGCTCETPLSVNVLSQHTFAEKHRARKDAQTAEASKKTINLMVHADTQGSVDAIQAILSRLPQDDVRFCLRSLVFGL